MLTLYHDGGSYPLQVDDYYVRQLANGLDEVIFEISIYDPAYMIMQEEEQITDRGGQRYLIKQIDAGATRAKVICQLDLDEWKQSMQVGYTNGSNSVYNTINAVKPAGWSVIDQALYSQRRTIKGDYTPLEICEACRSVYKVYIRWDNKLRIVRILPQSIGNPVGSFATRELNLKEINYKGKSTDFATRIYPYGKEGLTIEGATIDGQTYPTAYIDDHSYSDKIVSVYWKDERYTVVQNLFDDAKARLAQMAKPVRTYECSIVDLKATNPTKYANLDFSLFTVALLVDDTKGTSVNYQVIERHDYPYYPERNEVILDSAPQKITNTVVRIADAIENPNSDFQQIMDAEIELATGWLTNADSYVYMVRNPNGTIKEILFLDGTQDLSQATHVMRLNSAGLGFSKTGVNGRYTDAFVFDDTTGGHLIANIITAGSMSAARVRTGSIISVDQKMEIDLDNGQIILDKEKALRITAGNLQLDANGNLTITGRITATSGYIGGDTGFTIGSTKLYNGKQYLNTTTDGVYIGTNGISVGSFEGGSADATGFRVTDAGVMSVGGIKFFTGSGTAVSSYGLWAKNSGTHIGSGGPCDFNSEGDGTTNKRNYLRNGTTLSGGVNVDGGLGLSGDLNFDTSHGYNIWGVDAISARGTIYTSGRCEAYYGKFTTCQADNFVPSDRRIKEDITPLAYSEEFIDAVEPVRFKYKNRDGYHHGFIAQNIQEALKDECNIVITDPDGMLAVNYNEITADLVGVVQAQKKKIDALEKRIDALEKRLTRRVATLEALLEGDGK